MIDETRVSNFFWVVYIKYMCTYKREKKKYLLKHRDSFGKEKFKK